MKSCIFEGRVKHRREQPMPHDFEYRLFMMYLDLAELPRIFRGRWLWSTSRAAPARFDRRRHLGDPSEPLERSVRHLVERSTGDRPSGPIRLLTHLSYFGYCFNPVSFYYCFDSDDTRVEAIVAEVNNTPWGDRHCYVMNEEMNVGRRKAKRFILDKAMHVSPFMDMDLEYDWRFTEPRDNLVVHMKNLKDGRKFFGATLTLERKEITGLSLARMLLFYPFMTIKVFFAIHWQALVLWLKRGPVYNHPANEASVPAKQR